MKDMEAERLFWASSIAKLMELLSSSEKGLTAQEAGVRLKTFGHNTLKPRRRSEPWKILLRQFTSPIVLLLITAALLSLLLHDRADSVIILIIVVMSGFLGFQQEYAAATAVERLLDAVELKSFVLRDGKETVVPLDEVVPGDVIFLSAGSGVPGDARILESKNLYVNEAALTGETFPVEKQTGDLDGDTPLAKRTNSLFMGTHIVSGRARALVLLTGTETVFGGLSERIRTIAPETDFESGIRHFGYFLTEITFFLLLSIFAINTYLHKPVLESFLFALALAVGLTPQLLPAVISVNLARGAREMAKRKVIVKRLSAIENFGSMNVLCSDKTGTITQGRISVRSAVDSDGVESEQVLLYARLNALLQSGFKNPIDQALTDGGAAEACSKGWTCLDEIPYDFLRKRISVLVSHKGRAVMITKGALSGVLEVCATVDGGGFLEGSRAKIDKLYEQLSGQGLRTLGVAVKELPPDATSILKSDEDGMTFMGMLLLVDPLKEGIKEIVAALSSLGVGLKMITGDNKLVAAQVARAIGMENPRILCGDDVRNLSDVGLPVRVAETDVFAEIEPNQKERIVRALREAGNVVGYIGDGINDAPALHSADVGISVQEAVDAAKDAASIVLLDRDLAVLREGVLAGRRTFANTLKYVFMATSANFGNMFSMAGASLFLPFLPLLPKQILLTNLLTDMPELTIATDNVDDRWISLPRRWNMRFIRRFMMVFGLVSSLFDFLTFGVLLGLLSAGEAEFRTGWFVESVISAALIVLVVRTRSSFLKSFPSRPLFLATLLVVACAIALPYTHLGALFGFVPLPPFFMVAMGGIVAAYILAAEGVKRWFYNGSRNQG